MALLLWLQDGTLGGHGRLKAKVVGYGVWRLLLIVLCGPAGTQVSAHSPPLRHIIASPG